MVQADKGAEILDKALDDYKTASAAMSCGSSSCPHSRDRGGMMVNGPCRCYPSSHPLREFVYTAVRLASAVRETRQHSSKDSA